MKRWVLVFFLASLFCLLILPNTTFAADVIASGYCGGDATAEFDDATNSYKNLSWTLDTEGVLTISGSGAMKDYDNYIYDSEKEPTPWFSYGDEVLSIVIESGVEEIGDYAFCNCSADNVSIPNTISTVGNCAFMNCQKLTEITIPDSVTVIGQSVFSDCISLSRVLLSDSISVLTESMFRNCSNLEEITIPESINEYMGGVFAGCTSLKKLTILENFSDMTPYLEYLGDCPNCTEINIAETNEHFCSVDGVVYSKDKSELIKVPCGLSGSYTVEDGVIRIGERAFANCEKLTEIILSDDVIEIGSGAFFNTNISSISIPDSVTIIGDSAFSHSKIEEIILPEGLEEIRPETFFMCSQLKTVSIPNFVTSIGREAFSGCNELHHITIPANVTSIGDGCFAAPFGSSLNLIAFEGDALEMGRNVFDGRFEKTIGIQYYETASGWDDEFWSDFVRNPQHIWGEWTITSDPSEEEAGVRTHTCSFCGEVEEEYFDNPSEGALPRIRGVYLGITDFTVFGNTGPDVITDLTVLSTTGEDITDQVEILVISPAGENFGTNASHAGADCTWYDASSHTLVAGKISMEGPFTVTAKPLEGLSRGNSRSVTIQVRRDYNLDKRAMVIIETENHERDVTVVYGSEASVSEGIIIRDTFFDEYTGPIWISLLDESTQHVLDGCDITVDHPVDCPFTGAFGITVDYETKTIHYAPDAIPGIYQLAVCKSDQNLVAVGGMISQRIVNTTPIRINRLTYSSSDGEATITGCEGSAQVVIIPESIDGCPVTAIGEGAFSTQNDLRNITIPHGVVTIGENAFSGCDELFKVNYDGMEYQWNHDMTIAEGNDVLKNAMKSYLRSLSDNGSCGETGWGWDSDSGTLIINGQGTILDCQKDWAPWGKYRDEIRRVIIEDGVNRIGDYSFNDCSELTELTIPASVTEVGRNPFANCASLTSINVEEGNSAFFSIDGVLYSNDNKVLISCPAGKQGDFEIPDGVNIIAEHAFEGCSGLTGLSMPEGLTTIGEEAFYECDGLTEIEIPANVTSINESSFDGCDAIKTVVVAEENAKYKSVGGVLYMREPAKMIYCPFEITGAIEIPEGVESISSRAFLNRSSLTSVTIPKSVILINQWAFDGCTSLTDVYYGGTRAMWDAIEKQSGNDPISSAILHTAPITVIWLNEDGTELDRGSYIEGETEPMTEKIPKSEESGFFTDNNEYFTNCFERWEGGELNETVKTYTPVFTLKKPFASGTISDVNGSKITYTASNIPADGYLIVIRYDNGRMTDYRLIADPKETNTITMQGTGSEYKIISVEKDFMPICENWCN